MDLPSYKLFLQGTCAHCFQTLKSEENRMIKILAEYPKCEEYFDKYSEQEITNFEAIAMLYGHTQKSLADKFVEQFKSSIILSSEEMTNDENMCSLMATSQNLAFCNDCGLLFTQVYQINKKFRNLSNKNSLLSKVMPKEFSNINEDQLYALDECEMKIENECSEMEDDPSEDPLRVEISSSEGEENSCFENNTEEHNSGNESNNSQEHFATSSGQENCIFAGPGLSTSAEATQERRQRRKQVFKKELAVVLIKQPLPVIIRENRVLFSTPNNASSDLQDNFENDAEVNTSIIKTEAQQIKEKLKTEAMRSYQEVFKGPPYCCSKCSKSYQQVLGLRNHCAKEHNLELPRLKMYKKTSNSMKCDDCGLNFKKFEQFEAHHRMRHKIKYIPCQFCSKMFVNKKDFEAHVEKMHSVAGAAPLESSESVDGEGNEDNLQTVKEKDDNFENDRPRERYSLREKTKRFAKVDDVSDDDLDVQEDGKSSSDFEDSGSELSEKEYVPDKKSKQIKPELMSDKIGETKVTYTKKKRKNDHLKPYISVPIGKRSISNIQNYNYICRECGNRFQSISTMRFHLLNHTKESDSMTVDRKVIKGPPYQCPNCSKNFRQYTTLMMHSMRCHNTRLLTVSELSGKKPDLKSYHNCSECGLSFDGFRGLSLHYSKKHNMSLFICVECDARFSTKAELDSHCHDEDHRQLKTSSDQSSPFHDTVADDQTTTEVAEEAQERKEKLKTEAMLSYQEVFKGPPYCCWKCSNSYQQVIGLRNHCAKEHNLELPRLKMYKKTSNSMKCDDCGLTFKRFEQFEVHHRIMHKVKYIPCKMCPKMFPHKKEFETHMEKMHPVGGAIPLESESVGGEGNEDNHESVKDKTEICEEPFFCRECNFSFKNSLSITAHNRIHQSIKKFDCKNCTESFGNGMSLLHHLSSVHKVFAHLEHYRDCYRCTDCEDDECFDTMALLQKHFQNSNHSSFNITCAFCDMQFHSKSDLKFHKIVNHAKKYQKTFSATKTKGKCTFCDQTFSNVKEMSKHRLTHPKEEQLYRCEECPKVYTSSNSLSAHRQMIHMEKFQCDKCGKSIAGIRQYRAHCKMHIELASGIKPLCDLCGKTYTSKKQLQKHKYLTHSRKEEKHCEICGYVSKTSWYFKQHMKVHAKNGTPKPRKKKWYM